MDADLDLVPLDALLQAILRRSELAIVATSTGNMGEVSWARAGDGYRLLGLLEEYKFCLLTELSAARS